ncbi:hypothetical protein [Trebonia sp.]|uniref:hypothetical protein n=1 Tax=Trebonia sp. TaxID=2767075 RepID=UPI002625348E|nr:hypothetical protein [Trebonia sp.]
MYSKTRLGADQLSGGPKLSRRAKAIVFTVSGVVAAALVALGVWSAVGSDRYGPSANGCVNVTFASSTGGATLHYCGAAAKSFCRSAFASADRISLLARPQCVLAGLTKAKVLAG